MHRFGRRFLLASASAAGTLSLARTGRAEAMPAVPKNVLAFYYGWYGTPDTSGAWRHWQFNQAHQLTNTTDTPLHGPYDSHDPGVVNAQVAAARAIGITGLVSSWWGPGSFEDASLPPLLEAAQRFGMKITAYLEKLDGASAAARQQSAIAQLLYLLRMHAWHPAWLRVDGKPVIFVYARAGNALTPPAWRQVVAHVRQQAPGGVVVIGPLNLLGVFDGAHEYNVTGATCKLQLSQLRGWAEAHYRALVRDIGPKISCVTVIPGYNDTHVGRPLPRPTTPRDGGAVYEILWQAAIAAKPDWVVITSWNEWHEGTEIEPSVQYGDLYEEETRKFARQFLQE